MAITRTINEARDAILERINNVGSASYQATVIRFLNNALTTVSSMHDWQYLTKNTTITYSTTTGEAELPADFDRALSVHRSGSRFSLAEIRPQDFALAEEEGEITDSLFFCFAGFTQDTSTANPTLGMNIVTAPTDGTEFDLWYIKQMPEITASDTVVPNLPVHMWDLIQRMAMLDALKMVESPEAVIGIEQSHVSTFLEQYKRRETYGAAKNKSMRMAPGVTNYKWNIRQR